MRKVLSLLLCVAMLCSLVVISAQAEGGPQWSVANAVAIPGGTVTVDVNIANNPGIAALSLTITDTDGLGASLVVEDNQADTLGLTCDDVFADGATAYPFWSGAYNATNSTIGTLTFTIPDDAELGDYTISLAAGTGAFKTVNASGNEVVIPDSSFTITVTDKAITGVNVAIDAGLAIGIHVATSDPDDTSITAVDVAGREFVTITEYIEDEENGGYIYYLNVNPWAMDVDFVVDFTENFAIDDQGDEDDANDTLNLTTIPATAKTVGILSYCNKILGTSDKLDQLIADMLEFGRQAQIYKNGAATLALPEGLAATEAAWENGDGDPCSFGDYCSENFPEDLTGKNKTAKAKFKFVDAEIEFGAKFVVKFNIGPNGTDTAASSARVKVNGEAFELDDIEGFTGTFTYAFSPAEYGGVEFDLYAASNLTSTNFAWINNYGPAHYAAYLNDNYGEGAADILNVMEAFYNYGVSVEAYVGE